MKYLKLFEDNNESFIEIEPEDFNDATYFYSDNIISFDINEFNKVKKYLTEHFNNRLECNIRLQNDSSKLYTDIIIGDANFKSYSSIYAIKDEWYYMEFNKITYINNHASNSTLHYKCDQFDGLMDCLKEITSDI
jgi:hypothetical protein